MTIGLVGTKAGMTRVFSKDGASVAVTVIEASPNRITQIKTEDTDGYNAVQVTAGEAKQKGGARNWATRQGAKRMELRLREGRRNPAQA